MTEVEKLEAEKAEIEKRITEARRRETGSELRPFLESLIGMDDPGAMVAELDAAIRARYDRGRSNPVANCGDLLRSFQQRAEKAGND